MRCHGHFIRGYTTCQHLGSAGSSYCSYTRALPRSLADSLHLRVMPNSSEHSACLPVPLALVGRVTYCAGLQRSSRRQLMTPRTWIRPLADRCLCWQQRPCYPAVIPQQRQHDAGHGPFAIPTYLPVLLVPCCVGSAAWPYRTGFFFPSRSYRLPVQQVILRSPCGRHDYATDTRGSMRYRL